MFRFKMGKAKVEEIFCWFFIISLLVGGYAYGIGMQFSVPWLMTVGAYIEVAGLFTPAIMGIVKMFEYTNQCKDTEARLMAIVTGFFLAVAIYMLIGVLGLWFH